MHIWGEINWYFQDQCYEIYVCLRGGLLQSYFSDSIYNQPKGEPEPPPPFPPQFVSDKRLKFWHNFKNLLWLVNYFGPKWLKFGTEFFLTFRLIFLNFHTRLKDEFVLKSFKWDRHVVQSWHRSSLCYRIFTYICIHIMK